MILQTISPDEIDQLAVGVHRSGQAVTIHQLLSGGVQNVSGTLLAANRIGIPQELRGQPEHTYNSCIQILEAHNKLEAMTKRGIFAGAQIAAKKGRTKIVGVVVAIHPHDNSITIKTAGSDKEVRITVSNYNIKPASTVSH